MPRDWTAAPVLLKGAMMGDKTYSWAVRGYEKGTIPPLLILIPEGDDAAGAEAAAREAAKEFAAVGGTNITVERVEV